MDGCCSVSGVVTLRVAGRSGLSSPLAWTCVVQVASVKLFVMDVSRLIQLTFV